MLSILLLHVDHAIRPPLPVPTEDQLPAGFPTIDMGPQLKVVERTRTATMLCAASGNPDPDISWFKDFLPVNTTNNNGRIKQLRSGRSTPPPPLLSRPAPPQHSGESHNWDICFGSFVFFCVYIFGLLFFLLDYSSTTLVPTVSLFMLFNLHSLALVSVGNWHCFY